MNVLVTGASGFIGCHVVQVLLERRHRVAAVALPDDPLTRLTSLKKDVDVIRMSLDDTTSVRKAVSTWKPDVCIHLAWYAEPGRYLHSLQNLTALTSSLALFEILGETGCRRIIGAGTCLEYDTTFGYLQEDTPTRPSTLYAAAKLSLGVVGARLAEAAGVSFAWGRIFNLYGPQEDPRRLVSGAIQTLRRNQPFDATAGEQIRDYLHVSDVASAFCLLAEKSAEGVFNIASGRPVSVRHVLETLGALLDRRHLLRFGVYACPPGDPPFLCGRNDRLKALGWTPSFSLKEGLTDTIRRWKEIDTP
jgi:nucleoside-diphosphate-sugar epimerase